MGRIKKNEKMKDGQHGKINHCMQCIALQTYPERNRGDARSKKVAVVETR